MTTYLTFKKKRHGWEVRSHDAEMLFGRIYMGVTDGRPTPHFEGVRGSRYQCNYFDAQLLREIADFMDHIEL
jgi:hypothetical protein